MSSEHESYVLILVWAAAAVSFFMMFPQYIAWAALVLMTCALIYGIYWVTREVAKVMKIKSPLTSPKKQD